MGDLKTPKTSPFPSISERIDPTPSEINHGLCIISGDPYQDVYHREVLDPVTKDFLKGAIEANRAYRAPMFSENFYRVFLGTSLNKQREYAITTGSINSISSGQAGEIALKSPGMLVDLHTHPRAIADPGPVIMPSEGDLKQLITYSTTTNKAAAAVVIGRTCGGPMETAAIAIEGKTIYTSTNQLRLIYTKTNVAEDIKRLIPNISEYTFVYDPQKVNEIMLKFNASEENAYRGQLK